jgi:hypothetical protein
MAVGRPPNPPVEEDQLVCLGIVRSLLPYRERFLGAGPAVHGNTQLHLSDVLLVMLAAFFNPTVRSQRLIEQLSQLPWVQQHLKVEAVCKSTLSDALQRFEPQQLAPLIENLMKQVPQLHRIEKGQLEEVCQQILAADGSLWNLPADVLWALQGRSHGKKRGQVRINWQLDIRCFTPADLSVSGQAEGSEAAAFIPRLHENVIYLVDRNFVHFGFLHAVLEKNSELVLRLRESDRFEAQTHRPLDPRDVAAGVLSDSIGRLPGSSQKRGKSRTTAPPQRPLRLVVCCDLGTGKTLRILTSLLDLPAHVIAELYRRRWQIELFFRWLKVWANFEHLFSHSPQGITLQFYVAVIAVLLMHVASGRKVNRYSLFLLGAVAAGQATLEQILPMLDKIEREKQLEKARRARKKALAKIAPALPA